jgi:ketosteroid isomerase-like protein
MGGNLERTEEGYAAFNAGDVDTLVAMLTPDFEWHEAAEIPGPKSATSREEFVHFMRGFERLWEEFRFEPLELVESGDLVYARMRAVGRGRASEERIDFVIHHVWRIRDGQFARMDAYLDEDEAKAAAGVPV